ncbi:pre-mRNA-processing factor 19, partial [Phenoliferia sp. Uapishka_3]
MSLFCAISGQAPLHPVLSTTSGHVYEKELVTKYLVDNEGRDPITGEALSLDQLVDIKTAPSTPSAPPRPPQFTSVPSLLHVLQNEWDSTMFECLQLRKQGTELRQELSHALYKEDAAMRVLARVTKERDEAREALASVKATLGPAFSTGDAPSADVEMAEEQTAVTGGLPADARARVEETTKSLSATRKKRKPAATYATPADLKTYLQSNTIPSLHGTKPPGVTALALAKSASLLVTGGMDKNVQVYDRSTSKILATFKGAQSHSKKVTAVLATVSLTSADLPTHLISASLDKSIKVYATNGKKTLYDVSATLTSNGEVAALALHPTDTLFASASSDGSWSIHDLTTSPKPSTLFTVDNPADAAGVANSAIAFHPDGGLLAVGSSDSTIRVYQIVDGACVATFDAEAAPGPGAISSLSFSENGYTLASATAGSNLVKLWDLRKLANVHTIELEEDKRVNIVKFDPSAQFLAVGGTDLRVYANKSWEELVRNEENAGELTGVEWGVDGKEVVVAGLDRTVRFLASPEKKDE